MSQHRIMIIERYFRELLNEGNFAKAGEILTPDFTFYGPLALGGLNCQGLAEFIRRLRSAFSDKHFVELERVVERNMIASRFRMTGSHDGPFQGIPPTGRRIDVEGCDLFTLREGRISVTRAYFDLTTIMMQIGVLQSPTVREAEH